MLTFHQIDLFRRIGYLRFENFFDGETTAALRNEMSHHIQERIQPFFADASGRIYRLNNLFDRSDVFKSVFKATKLLELLTVLLGPNIEFVKNRHNHATMNTKADTGFRLHRDNLQWTRNMVSIIIYLDDATIESGATHIIPGSQFLPFVGTPNNGGTWMDGHHVFASLIDQSVAIPVKAGGMLIFDSLAFHSVGTNTTDEPRRSIVAGYTSADELLPVDDNHYRELVIGERLYRGSELKWVNL
jgi:ectoine hydroxylase-related dioxygenase (phytanoyl-CoA dioxygenase family)